jgi:hypothetical protein
MSVRRVIGLCLLSALLAGSFAASSATAATKGTTAFTCKETGPGGGFTKAHCKASDAGSGNFSHVAIPQNTKTELIATNESTGGELVPSQLMQGFGDTLTGVAAEVSGSGVLTNAIDASTGEHYLHGEITLTYTGITESEGSGCEAYTDNGGEKGGKGVIHTTSLTFTSKGQGDYVKIFPIEGAPFATVILSNCKVEALNGTYKWIGSMKCPFDGATILCNKDEITTAKTLRVNTASGPAAGFFGSITLKGRESPLDSYKPISATTVET